MSAPDLEFCPNSPPADPGHCLYWSVFCDCDRCAPLRVLVELNAGVGQLLSQDDRQVAGEVADLVEERSPVLQVGKHGQALTPGPPVEFSCELGPEHLDDEVEPRRVLDQVVAEARAGGVEYSHDVDQSVGGDWDVVGGHQGIVDGGR